ncbi:MAG: PilZ domain-containing protein [Lysobacteraceae bacterium]|jgi:hypothetical protein|nr:PilZ domain-containing protein [Xanthomonadaceae bacterium]MCZ8317981.1 PilZ domain-containing protein [Silanimonas sp.]
MSVDPIGVVPASLGFRQLRLRPKTLVQLSASGDGAAPEDWLFAAAIEGRGLMLAPVPGRKMGPMAKNARFLVQGFTGQYDFRFETGLLGVFDVPFHYALLGWPDRVDGRLVRQALRIRTLLPATLVGGEGPGGTGQRASIVDLSAAGALVETATPIGDVGTPARLVFTVEAEGERLQITAHAAVCHRRTLDHPVRERVGLSFRALPKPERLMLSLYLAKMAAELDP